MTTDLQHADLLAARTRLWAAKEAAPRAWQAEALGLAVEHLDRVLADDDLARQADPKLGRGWYGWPSVVLVEDSGGRLRRYAHPPTPTRPDPGQPERCGLDYLPAFLVLLLLATGCAVGALMALIAR